MGRTRTGWLSKRAGRNGWKPIYYWNVKVRIKDPVTGRDKQTLISLSTHETSREKAERRRDELIGPFLQADQREAAQRLYARITGLHADEEQRRQRKDDIENPPLPLGKAWDTYEDSPERKKCSDTCLDSYDRIFRQFKEWAGRLPSKPVLMRDITPDHCGQYSRFLDGMGYKSRTYNWKIAFLRQMWKTLARQVKAPSAPSGRGNPWEAIPLKTLVQDRKRNLTEGECRLLIEAAEGQLKAVFIVGYYTGLRLGDACTLKWDEVDFARETRVGDITLLGVIVRWARKTRGSKTEPVVIPMHPGLREYLLAVHGETGKDEYILPEIADLYLGHIGSLSDRVSDVFDKCGIRRLVPGTGAGSGRRAIVEAGFHSLRHTLVTTLLEQGVPLNVVKYLTGHSTAIMTEHYDHVGGVNVAKGILALPDVMPSQWRLAVGAKTVPLIAESTDTP